MNRPRAPRALLVAASWCLSTTTSFSFDSSGDMVARRRGGIRRPLSWQPRTTRVSRTVVDDTASAGDAVRVQGSGEEIGDVESYLESLEDIARPVATAQWPPVPENYSLRRQIYEALVPLDRGEFTWEMLVPWLPTDEKLTQQDKVIVFVTFVALALTGQQALSPEASTAVHLSYVAQFFSYAIGNPVGFRIIAMVSSLLEILGDVVEPGVMRGVQFEMEDGIPVLYNLLFLPINGYYVMLWALNRETLALSDEEEALYILGFAALGFTRGQFSRLLTSANWEQIPTAEEGGAPKRLCTEGEPMVNLFVPIAGDLDVMVKDTVAATIPEYQIIGEASLLENLQSEDGSYHLRSRSTIVAEPGSSYVWWPQSALFKLSQSNAEMAYALQLMIARTLSVKLRNARNAQQRMTVQMARLEQGLVTAAANDA